VRAEPQLTNFEQCPILGESGSGARCHDAGKTGEGGFLYERSTGGHDKTPGKVMNACICVKIIYGLADRMERENRGRTVCFLDNA
jgi:hypothetical protein